MAGLLPCAHLHSVSRGEYTVLQAHEHLDFLALDELLNVFPEGVVGVLIPEEDALGVDSIHVVGVFLDEEQAGLAVVPSLVGDGVLEGGVYGQPSKLKVTAIELGSEDVAFDPEVAHLSDLLAEVHFAPLDDVEDVDGLIANHAVEYTFTIG